MAYLFPQINQLLLGPIFSPFLDFQTTVASKHNGPIHQLSEHNWEPRLTNHRQMVECQKSVAQILIKFLCNTLAFYTYDSEFIGFNKRS